MTDFNDLAGRYIDMWNDSDDASRRRRIEALWADDARYIDPLVVAEGHEAINATVAAVQGQFPGFRFKLAGPVDGHHDQARFTWTLGPAGAEDTVVGFDVAVRDGDGRLTTVLGFLDKVPSN